MQLLRCLVASGLLSELILVLLVGAQEAVSKGKPHVRTLSASTLNEPIRIASYVINLTEEGYNCRSVGEKVQVGEGLNDCKELPPLPKEALDRSDCLHICRAVDIAGEEQRLVLQSALLRAARRISSAVSVLRPGHRQERSTLENCMGRHHVDTNRVPVAYDADLIIVADARPLPEHAPTQSVVCSRDSWGRPASGLIFVSPVVLSKSSLFHDSGRFKEALMRKLLHEMMHILGFEGSSFLLFRDENLKLRRRVTAPVAFWPGDVRQAVITPAVVSRAREHFDAEDLDGVPLALSPSDPVGSAPHWHPKYCFGEIMTASVGSDNALSALSLALLEDSGWYSVNYSAAERWSWGRGQGAAFLRSGCDKWEDGTAYHCRGHPGPGTPKLCTHDAASTGFCANTTAVSQTQRRDTLSELPDAFAEDSCMLAVPELQGLCAEPPEDHSTLPDWTVYGESSRCFDVSIDNSALAVCLPHNCSQDGLLSFELDG
uniref:Leishmanolysin n=1 Tax=Tetraselmis sp. GSL018 TaxID=582737 RepID=A0A061RBA4_9CHLO